MTLMLCAVKNANEYFVNKTRDEVETAVVGSRYKREVILAMRTTVNKGTKDRQTRERNRKDTRTRGGMDIVS
jgi:hypothetical protein